MEKWLSIVGIGEDGLEGLNQVGRSLLSQASVIVGGERHLAMLPPEDCREKLVWRTPIQDSVNEIIRRRGQRVCVLASGDPMWYGIGVTLTRHIPMTEITIIPSVSTLSLACSRLGWSLTEVETVSLCGRPPALLNAWVYPGAKLLVLSESGQTPAIVAEILTQQGFGDSLMVVLEHLGGKRERLIEGTAASWNAKDIAKDIADLNAIAINCRRNPVSSRNRVSLFYCLVFTYCATTGFNVKQVILPRSSVSTINRLTSDRTALINSVGDNVNSFNSCDNATASVE